MANTDSLEQGYQSSPLALCSSAFLSLYWESDRPA